MKKNLLCMVTLIIACMLCMSSCMKYTSFDKLTNQTTTYSYQQNDMQNIPDGQYYDATTSIYTVPETTVQNIVENQNPQSVIPETTQQVIVLPEITTAANVNSDVPPAVTESSKTDYSSFSKAQIVNKYKEALEKTRAYTGPISATVTESFDAKIKDAHPGGALTELLADNVVKLVGSEGQQTLNFSGGQAVNADGESVPVLLPQRSSFMLPVEGVAGAKIEESAGKLHIVITLVPETVSMGEIPKYNAGAVGYLDTSSMDFKIVTLSRVDITYTGSVIDAVIGTDGYVESVTYTINMSTYAELSGMGISGYGTLEGAQTEKWTINKS